MNEKEKLEKIRKQSRFLFGKATCPICGTEFQKTNFHHTYCCKECSRIAKCEKGRLKTLRRENSLKYDSVLDMKTWEWKKIEHGN